MTSPDSAPQPPGAPTPGIDQIVGRFIHAMGIDAGSGQPRIGRGDLAALRRMDPDRPSVPAFWRLLARATDGAMVRSDDDERRWALVAHGMALMAPDHHASVEIGAALHTIDYAEGRLARLLNARGPQFRALVPRLCRHLAHKQQPLDWYRFARLILTEGSNEDVAEAIRLHIARGYYRAASQSQTDKNVA